MVRNHHPKNERLKRRYAIWLREAQRMSDKSVDHALAAVAQFEATTGYRDFALFNVEQARKYKRLLDTGTNTASGKPVAKATATARLNAIRRFFVWLADEPGYRSKLTFSDADYFNPSHHDSRIASARREKPFPSVEQVRHVLRTMPAETVLQKRDRAVMAFIFLTGARDDAVASAKLRHVNLEGRRFDQDAREVRTKRRKTFTTWFFRVGDDIEEIVAAWISCLRDELLFGPNDPLLPSTKMALNADGHFTPGGVDRAHWSNADPIRRVFRQAFEQAGLPYFDPHSLRNTLTMLGERTCATPEEFKAWSQNLGHEKVMTTFSSYGTVAPHRQGEIIAGLRTSGRGGNDMVPDAETIGRVLDHLRGKASA